MKLNTFRTCALVGLLFSLAGFAACAREVYHSESDKPGWFGGRTRQETTVYQNPDGTTSTEHVKEVTK